MRSSHRSKTEDTKQSVRRLCWDNVLLSFSPTPFRFVFFSILSVCLSVCLFFSLRSAGLRPSGSVDSNRVEIESSPVESSLIESSLVQPCRVQSSHRPALIPSNPSCTSKRQRKETRHKPVQSVNLDNNTEYSVRTSPPPSIINPMRIQPPCQCSPIQTTTLSLFCPIVKRPTIQLQ